MQRFPQLTRGQALHIHGRPGVELTGARQTTDDHRVETGILDKANHRGNGRRIVARDRDAQLLASAMCLAFHLDEAQRVERAHQADTREELGRRDARSLLDRFGRHRTVAVDVRVPKIDDNLPLHERAVVLPHLRGGSVRHGDDDDFTPLRRFVRKPGARLRAGFRHQVLQCFRVTRREHHLVAGLRELQAERAALPARADEGHLQRLLRLRLCGQRSAGDRQCQCGQQEFTASLQRTHCQLRNKPRRTRSTRRSQRQRKLLHVLRALRELRG